MNININHNRYKHGMSKTRPYRTWSGMKARCNDTKNEQYHNYGGRGITYDKKWETFEGFWEDMEKGYRDGLTIDRIDSNKNYCKENCRWATQEQQNNNRRNNHLVTYKGKTQSLMLWCKELNLNYDRVKMRLNKLGMNAEQAFTNKLFDKGYKIPLPEHKKTRNKKIIQDIKKGTCKNDVAYKYNLSPRQIRNIEKQYYQEIENNPQPLQRRLPQRPK